MVVLSRNGAIAECVLLSVYEELLAGVQQAQAAPMTGARPIPYLPQQSPQPELESTPATTAAISDWPPHGL